MMRGALALVKEGLPVLPVWGVREGSCLCGAGECGNPGKHPVGRLTPRGLRDATLDAATVRAWWRQEPLANVAVATGGARRLVAIDVDGPEGESALAELMKRYGAFPEGPEVATGRGRHLYFRDDHGGVRNSAGKLGKGIDVRAAGGYLISPPSLHANGNRYRWAPGRSIADVRLPPLPEKSDPGCNGGGR